MKNAENSTEAGEDKLSREFLIDSAEIFAKHISALFNPQFPMELSQMLAHFRG